MAVMAASVSNAQEIEEITGLSNGSIKTGLMRARNNLYTVLTEKMAFKTQHDYGN